MSENIEQAYISGQVADGLSPSDQAIIAGAILNQESTILTESTLENDNRANKHLSKFMFEVKKTTSMTSNIQRRSKFYSDSPAVELLQEVLGIVEDLSYAVAKRKSSQNVVKDSSKSKNMTTTSKYALSKTPKSAKVENQWKIAKLKKLKELHGQIKHALENKHTISNEQVEKIRKGVIAMRNDIHKELGSGQSIPKLESNKALNQSMKTL